MIEIIYQKSTNTSYLSFKYILKNINNCLKRIINHILWNDKSINSGIVNKIIEPIPSAILKSNTTFY